MKALPQALGTVASLLLGCPVASAEPAVFRDEANLFRAATRAQAAREIAEIRRRFNRDVIIETVTAALERDKVKAMRQLDEKNYFADLGKQRAQAAGVDGILILFCGDPRYIQITVWPESQPPVFNDEDAARLYKLLRHRHYWVSGFDRALLDGLAMIGRSYQRNLQIDDDADWYRAGAIAAVMCGIVAVWLVLLFADTGLRRESDKDRAVADPALLETMFGHMSAWWIHDRLPVYRASAAVKADSTAPPPPSEWAAGPAPENDAGRAAEPAQHPSSSLPSA